MSAYPDEPDNYLNPDWDNKDGFTRNWHDYVPHRLRALWPTFNDEQKAALSAHFLKQFQDHMVALL